MPRQLLLLLLLLAAALLALPACATPSASAKAIPRSDKPNFIIFYADNLGYSDIGPFGSKLHRTPNLDQLAAEGMKLTHFYSTSGVCTPSRASIMTGCYPRRVNMHLNAHGGRVLRPVDPTGLHPDEITIARLLKNAGYATAAIGKWHLGDQLPFLPTRHGFDFYQGIPYSDNSDAREDRFWPPIPLMRNETVIEAPVDRDDLTQRETAEAIRFIQANKNRPFFLYIPHAMPGSTTAPYSSPAFKGKSANGPWGDSVEELDWSAGQILATLKRLGLDHNTLVIWTSDNGAPRRNPPQGRNEPLAGWGYSTAEGGQRVPAIARWPGKIPPGSTCDQLATTMDLFVTFGKLAGAKIPTDRIIDGHDITPLLFAHPNASTPYHAFYYYEGPQLQAVRSGPWKLYLPLDEIFRPSREGPHGAIRLATHGQAAGGQWRPVLPNAPVPGPPLSSLGPQKPRLFNVVTDPGETTNLIDQHPDLVDRLTALADQAREDLGDTDRQGKGQRPVGRVENPTPRLLPSR